MKSWPKSHSVSWALVSLVFYSFQATAVGSDVLSVTATDKDATTENKRMTYSILVSHE